VAMTLQGKKLRSNCETVNAFLEKHRPHTFDVSPHTFDVSPDIIPLQSGIISRFS
jgi:hypothetical protein